MQNYITWLDADACTVPAPGPKTVLQRAWNTLNVWNQRWQGRRDLARLDARLLADVGVKAEAAAAEAAKPFWEA